MNRELKTTLSGLPRQIACHGGQRLIDWFNFREPVSSWTHFLWLLLAFPGTWLLWRRSRGDRLKRAGMLTFGLGLVLCYGGSWLFHAVRLSPEAVDRFNTLDHIGIYVLIAGSCTPIALVVLRGAWRLSLMLLSSWPAGYLMPPCGRSGSAVCSTAPAPSSTWWGGRRSCPACSRPMRCFTCSSWAAA